MSRPNQDAQALNRVIRKGLRVLLLLLAFIAASFVGVKILIMVKVRKLHHMLVELQSLKPGISSFDDAIRIGKEYGADKPAEWAPCTREKCTVAMGVTWCNPGWIPTNHIDNRLFNRLGIHFWTADGWIEVEQNRVILYGASVGVEGPDLEHRWHEATWETSREIPLVNPSDEKEFRKNYDPKHDRSPEFLVDWTDSPHGDRAEWLYAHTSTRATDAQHHAAQDFDLKCLTRFGDCSSVCDLLPGAARYYNDGLSTAELSFPHPHCD
jgi:hypothetical protein